MKSDKMKRIIFILSFLAMTIPFKVSSQRNILSLGMTIDRKEFKELESITFKITLHNTSNHDIEINAWFDVDLSINSMPKIINNTNSDFYIELKSKNKKKWDYFNYPNYSEVQDISDTNDLQTLKIISKKSMTYNVRLLVSNFLPKNKYRLRVFFLAAKYCECSNVYSNWVEFEIK